MRQTPNFFAHLAKYTGNTVEPEDSDITTDTDYECMCECDCGYVTDDCECICDCIDDDSDSEFSETEEDREWAENHIVSGSEEWDEEWKRSECPCDICVDMNRAVDQWSTMRQRRAETPIGDIVACHVEKMVDRVMADMDDEMFIRGRPLPKL